MSAVMNEEPDRIDPEHYGIHADLEAWGRWSREKRQKRECGSGERSYRSPQPWDAPPLQAFLPANPRHLQIDRAVLAVISSSPNHGTALRLYYAQLCPPWLVARRIRIEFGDVGKWMHDSRAMVLRHLMLTGWA